MKQLMIATAAIGLAGILNAATVGETFTDIDFDPNDPTDARFMNMEMMQGHIPVPQAHVDLNLSDDYYYISGADAEFILTDIWGNPESSSMGMIYPIGTPPWAGQPFSAEITYEDSGHVETNDAETLDYDDLLSTMRKDINSGNKWRTENGYDTIELVGWAQEPFYDAEHKTLHWAKELRFGSDETNSLNYNLRVLGRKGVLVTNFIADASSLEAVKAATPELSKMITFQEGQKYADFDPSIDKIAAGGIAALIAGKVAAKAGLFAVLLVALKKFGVFIVIGLAAIGRTLFSRKKTKSE